MNQFGNFQEQKFALNIERKPDGYWIITSDKHLGLLLSGKDLTALLNDVEFVIAKLEELNRKDICPYCKTEVVDPASYLEDHEECLPC